MNDYSFTDTTTAFSRQVDGPEGLELLRQIGEQLDDDLYPVIHEGGQVEPGPGRLPSARPGREDQGKEVRQDAGQEAGQGPERSAARPRSGAADEGAAAGEGTPGSPAQVLRTSGLRPDVVGDLEGAVKAYPQMRIRLAPPLAWLSAWIWPIRGLQKEALLVIGYSLDCPTTPRSWAWWDAGVWIGPRHTNYPDGSICSYEPPDGTWGPGRPLVELLDLQVVWIVRHLYLRHFGRWPARQVLHTAFERLREHEPGEFCGCDSGRRYDQCCLETDRRAPHGGLREFLERFGTHTRTPRLVFDSR